MRVARDTADGAKPASTQTGSRRLLSAVLQRALQDARGPARTGSTACTSAERQGARGWFSNDGVEPMSFRWLCMMLDLDPEAVLQRIAAADESENRS